MECVVAEDTDSLITYVSEEDDQDSEVTSVVPYNLQDVLPYTSGPSVPMGTQYGEIGLNNSNKNHIGPKYIASHITIVQTHETTSEPPEGDVTKRKYDNLCSCKVIVINVVLVLLTLIGICSITWYVTDSINDNNEHPLNTSRLVGRDEWKANPLVVNYTYKYLNPINVITIAQTSTNFCNTLKACSEIVREIQNVNIKNYSSIDIDYNFLIGGDGNVYEGRGWSGPCNSLTADNGVVRVGFIGDYSSTVRPNYLSDVQKLAFLLFINKIGRDHITTDYQVLLGCCSQDYSSFIGHNLFKYYYEAYFPESCPDFNKPGKKYYMCDNTPNVTIN